MKKQWLKKVITVFLAALFCVNSASMYAVEEKDSIAPVDKISKELYQEFERLEAQGKNLAQEKIPVWIWYEDINQKQVDREVKEQTGLSQGNIAVDFEMPRPSLIYDMKNEKIGSQEQLHQYLERTTVARLLENQRAETYIMKRREICREKYNQKSISFLNKRNIKKNDVIFKSEYAPTVVANLTKQKIESLVKNINVESVGLYEELEATPCTFETSKQTIRVDKVFSQIGLTGNNVKVGMFENGVPLAHEELDSDRIKAVGSNVSAQDHPRWVAICLAGSTLGIAPEALIYATNANLNNIEAMISQGIVVMNVSWGYESSGPAAYTYEDKWFDHIAKEHNLLLMCSAGNEEDDGHTCVRSPAMAYNTLAVGAFEDNSTPNNLSDDRLFLGSSYNHTGSLKPDLVAPMNTTNGATSFAAPIVTGIATLLLELKPSLSYQPQVLKAILMASCQRKVLSHAGTAAETMEQGLTRTQGAGAIDAWNAVCIVAQGNYGYGEVKNAAEIRNFVQPAYGASHMNVSIAWLRENTISSSDHASGAVTSGIQHNLNLYVYRNGTQVGSSTNSNSSTEMAYIPLSASEARYQIKVSNYNHASTETVRYGYAYSTDNMAFRENLTGTDYPEGIYYIRNKANAGGAYLTVDEQTGQISQKTFMGGANQQWVSSKIGNLPFALQTSSSAYPGYLSKNGDENGAVISKNIPDYIYFGGNGFDNTFGVQYQAQPLSNELSLTAQNAAVQNSPVIWRFQGIPDRFQWYFEPVGYIRGDLNRDGTVSTADALLAQKYISKIVTLDAAQRFLGDMNNDGKVNLTDVTLIQKLISA